MVDGHFSGVQSIKMMLESASLIRQNKKYSAIIILKSARFLLPEAPFSKGAMSPSRKSDIKNLKAFSFNESFIVIPLFLIDGI